MTLRPRRSLSCAATKAEVIAIDLLLDRLGFVSHQPLSLRLLLRHPRLAIALNKAASDRIILKRLPIGPITDGEAGIAHHEELRFHPRFLETPQIRQCCRQ